MLSRGEAGRKKGKQELSAKHSEKHVARPSAAASGRTPPSKPKTRPNVLDDLSQKEKKSLWNWKPLKALANSRNKKFKCCFSLKVHTIVGLPSRFENSSLRVHWRMRDDELSTRSAKVIEQIAEFEESLTHNCVVHGRSGANHSAKYDARQFMLFPSVVGAKHLDLGKHNVDLTRLFPLTLEELEDEKSTGTWTTSFKLSGEARGAVINVSFGYSVSADSSAFNGNRRVGDESAGAKQVVGKSKIVENRGDSLLSILADDSREFDKFVEDANGFVETKAADCSEVAFEREELRDEGKHCDEMNDIRDFGIDCCELGFEVEGGSEKLREKALEAVIFGDNSRDFVCVEENHEVNEKIEGNLMVENHFHETVAESLKENHAFCEIINGVKGGKGEFDEAHEGNDLNATNGMVAENEGDHMNCENENDMSTVNISELDVEVNEVAILGSDDSHDLAESEGFFSTKMCLISSQLFDGADVNDDHVGHVKMEDNNLQDVKDDVGVSNQSAPKEEIAHFGGTSPNASDLLNAINAMLSATETVYDTVGDKSVVSEVEEARHETADEQTSESVVGDEGGRESLCRSDDANEFISEMESKNESFDAYPETVGVVDSDSSDCPPVNASVDSVNSNQTGLLEDDEENVENDFLDMLGIDDDEDRPESPRECLLRDFEKDGFSFFDFDTPYQRNDDHLSFSDEFDLDSILRDIDMEEDLRTGDPAIEAESPVQDLDEQEAFRSLPPTACHVEDVLAGEPEIDAESRTPDFALDQEDEESFPSPPTTDCHVEEDRDPETEAESRTPEFSLDEASFQSPPPTVGHVEEDLQTGEPEIEAELLIQDFDFDQGLFQYPPPAACHVDEHLWTTDRDGDAESLILDFAFDEGSFLSPPPTVCHVEEDLRVRKPEIEAESLIHDFGFYESPPPTAFHVEHDFTFDDESFRSPPSSACHVEEVHRTIEPEIDIESLMQDFAFGEESFQSPPPTACHVDDLPPLGEGLGSFMQTKNGGFIRSMSPTHFQKESSLIMQVSSPVVIPAELGSDANHIIQGLASIGIEKLSMQANKLMPLDDIAGKTMHQVAYEAGASQVLSNHSNHECVTLEELAPLAMEKIEALSMEGLKLQSGVSDRTHTSPDGTAGVRLLQMGDAGATGEVDGLMGLSLTLDQWMRLDAGEFSDDEGAVVSEETSKILAAHHANTLDSIRSKKRGKRSGLLGNTFTVSLLVQLRDPLRDFEAVGTPMLALVQVERVFATPKPKIYYNVPSACRNQDSEDVAESAKEKERVVEKFVISDVHVAGLENESGKEKVWGTANQQKCGSRWLLANGMGKNSKNALPSSKGPAKAQSDTLWSVSSKSCASPSTSKWNTAGKGPSLFKGLSSTQSRKL